MLANNMKKWVISISFVFLFVTIVFAEDRPSETVHLTPPCISHLQGKIDLRTWQYLISQGNSGMVMREWVTLEKITDGLKKDCRTKADAKCLHDLFLASKMMGYVEAVADLKKFK